MKPILSFSKFTRIFEGSEPYDVLVQEFPEFSPSLTLLLSVLSTLSKRITNKSPEVLATILDEIKSTLKDTFDAKNEEIAGKQKEKLEEKFLCFGRQASGTDILFASVTFKDIVAEIKSRFSIDINYKKVHMNNSIKKIGIYEFFIDLSENITVKMYLSVGRSVENAEAMIKEYTKI